MEEIFEGVAKIKVASGKKILDFSPEAVSSEEFLKKALGRTGNLRAPTVKKGDTLYIGFNETMYSSLF